MSPAEDHALNGYKGENYFDINDDLRESGYSDVWDTDITAIDSAFAKTKLSEPLMVHRGTDIEIFDDYDDMVGSFITDDACVSTSMRRNIASAHADGAQIEIRVPAGAQAIFMDRWKVTGFDSESEILLPRGSKFMVVSDNADPDNRVMVWELVLND